MRKVLEFIWKMETASQVRTKIKGGKKTKRGTGA